MKRYILASLLCLNMSVACASVSSDLGNFFNSLGYDTNSTDVSAYKGQEAGYYTGGSLYARNSVRDYQLVSVQLPSVKAGCGGIDLFTGGFSFINSQQLVDAMENIANNAVSYAVMLGIQTVTPEIADEMQTLQSYANFINQGNINSCQAAASMVGAVWPKTDVAEQAVCQSIGTSKGLFSDYTSARMECGDGGQRNSTLNNAKSDDNYKNMVLQNTNIAWQAIQKNGFLTSDNELAELFMSLSGTIIVKSGGSDNASNQFALIPSLADNQQLINAIMNGGDAPMYKCDTTSDCLNPTLSTVTISQSDGLVNQVNSLLTDMYTHILEDTAITNEEKGLLQSTNIPLYKMLTVEAAYSGGSSVIDLNSYSELIAASILNQYLTENLDIIQKSAGILQYPQQILTDFNKGLETARQDVAKQNESHMAAFNTNLQLIQRTQLMEQQLAGQLSDSLSQTLKWA
ncbi:MAG: conjugal transfer protein TraH, partial [Gammaproteobacteria bacterium]